MQEKTLSLYHRIRPANNVQEKAPALLLFHGYGSDENDLFSFADDLPEELIIISARAPHALPPYGNAWYAINFDSNNGKFNDLKQAIKSRDLIVKFIDEIIEHYPIDPRSISLLGFSQGSILSYAVALSFPEKIKNIIALSGYISEDMCKDGFLKNNFSKLDFYCSHGSVDQVIPVELARKSKPFLDKLGIKNCYAEFPVGHGVAPQNFYALRDWLKSRI